MTEFPSTYHENDKIYSALACMFTQKSAPLHAMAGFRYAASLILEIIAHLTILVLQKKAQQGKLDSLLLLSVAAVDQSWMGQSFDHQPVWET